MDSMAERTSREFLVDRHARADQRIASGACYRKVSFRGRWADCLPIGGRVYGGVERTRWFTLNEIMKLAVFLLTTAVLFAAGPPYAITKAKIVASPGSTIADGTIDMRNGLIEAVGTGVAIPSDARIFDAKGLTIYAGLIDAATHYGFAAPPRPAGGPAPIQTAPPNPSTGEPNSPERYLRPRAAGMNADLSAASRMT